MIKETTRNNNRISSNTSFLINIGILVWICINLLSSEGALSSPGTYEFNVIVFATVSLMVICLVLHELGHLIVADIYNMRIRKIKLSCFGGIVFFDQSHKNKSKSESTRKSIALFLSGPVVSLLIGFFIGLFWLHYTQYEFEVFPIKESTENALRLISLYNIFIGLINLLPIFPFDGYRVLSVKLNKKFRSNITSSNIIVLATRIFYTALIIFAFYIVAAYSNYYGFVLIIYCLVLLGELKKDAELP